MKPRARAELRDCTGRIRHGAKNATAVLRTRKSQGRPWRSLRLGAKQLQFAAMGSDDAFAVLAGA
ncbi:MAG: hypothetical protein IPK87_14495 [Planctomycetes bacterium]|nr:hypothetical protein [Planctomycetota bacterium]